MEKSYTVKEIDKLRMACRSRFLYGTTNPENIPRASRSYAEDQMSKSVEEMIKTYMVAGIIAEDIYLEDGFTPS